MNSLTRNLIRALAFVLLVPVVGATAGRALAQSAGQETYDTTDAAVAAFTAALEAGDDAGYVRVFGPEIHTFASGEMVADKAAVARVRDAAKKSVRPVAVPGGKRVVLYLGALNWPFPIPIVKNAAGKWYFDTVSGREEYLNRVIGRNELATILVMQVFSEAETEYATEDRDGDGVLEYAQKIRSSEGAKDGLYWPTAEGEPGSPLGEFAASARAEGYTAKGENASKSYHGYVYRVITKQGPAAVGGAKDYVVDGNMVHGFAAIAYPVNWGASGIMTFMIGPDGRVFEKNLGPKTEELATAITEFNPDKSWRQSEY